MTDTEKDLEDITHLDFDPDQAPKCIGYKAKALNGVVTGNEHNCPNQAKVMTVRSCCGEIKPYCLDCYNGICAFHVNREPRYHTIQPGGSPHPVTGKPFSQVEFL